MPLDGPFHFLFRSYVLHIEMCFIVLMVCHGASHFYSWGLGFTPSQAILFCSDIALLLRVWGMCLSNSLCMIPFKSIVWNYRYLQHFCFSGMTIADYPCFQRDFLLLKRSLQVFETQTPHEEIT